MGVRSPVTALLVVAVLAGCAIPIDDQARNLVAELPDALLPAASTTTEAPAPTESVQIYMARLTEDDRMILEVVDRIDGVTIPQDIVLYGRAFGLLAGVIAALDPEVNGIIVAKPMIMQALMRPENFAPLPAAEPEAELAAAVPA